MRSLDDGSVRSRLSPDWVAIVVVTVMFVWAALNWQTRSLDLSTWASEWGGLEIFHNALIALSGVLFWKAWRDSMGAIRVAAGALAILAAAAFVREIDIKKLSAVTGPEWLYDLADNGLQEALLIAMTLPIGVYLLRERQFLGDLIRLALRWDAWPLYLAGGFILAGVVFDDHLVTTLRGRFWEEVIETYGYVFLAVAARRHLLRAREDGHTP